MINGCSFDDSASGSGSGNGLSRVLVYRRFNRRADEGVSSDAIAGAAWHSAMINGCSLDDSASGSGSGNGIDDELDMTPTTAKALSSLRARSWIEEVEHEVEEQRIEKREHEAEEQSLASSGEGPTAGTFGSDADRYADRYGEGPGMGTFGYVIQSNNNTNARRTQPRRFSEPLRGGAHGKESLKTTSGGRDHFFKLGACRPGGCRVASRQRASERAEAGAKAAARNWNFW